MKIYWLYGLPTWLSGDSGTLTVGAFVAFGLVGLYLTRRWVQRLDSGHPAYNHIVGFYFAGVTVLYGVCAGLLAIGACATYSDVQERVDHEATALGALYRDIDAYPEPARAIMKNDLRRYTRAVIGIDKRCADSPCRRVGGQLDSSPARGGRAADGDSEA